MEYASERALEETRLSPLTLAELRRRALAVLNESCSCPTSAPDGIRRWSGCPGCWRRWLQGFPVACTSCKLTVAVEILNGRFESALQVLALTDAGRSK